MPQPERRVDAYVDACTLDASAHNPASVSAWGAVIIERDGHGVHTRYLSGAGDDALGSTQNEQIGILHVLADVDRHEARYKPPPHITLHTDQQSLLTLQAQRKQSVRVKISKPDALHERILAQAEAMGVMLHYQRDAQKSLILPIDQIEPIGFAHRLARAAAWGRRLEKQGYVHLASRGALEGEKAEAYVRSMLPALPLLGRGLPPPPSGYACSFTEARRDRTQKNGNGIGI